MPEVEAVEFTKQELQALGMVIALWMAEHRSGASLVAVLMLAAAADEMDSEVLFALIDRAVLKMAHAEDAWGSIGPWSSEEERDETRARMLSRLDQQFAQFRAEGRTLFPGQDDEGT